MKATFYGKVSGDVKKYKREDGSFSYYFSIGEKKRRKNGDAWEDYMAWHSIAFATKSEKFGDYIAKGQGVVVFCNGYSSKVGDNGKVYVTFFSSELAYVGSANAYEPDQKESRIVTARQEVPERQPSFHPSDTDNLPF